MRILVLRSGFQCPGIHIRRQTTQLVKIHGIKSRYVLEYIFAFCFSSLDEYGTMIFKKGMGKMFI
jgi:hypothetical protein